MNTNSTHIQPIFWVRDQQFSDQILGLPREPLRLIYLFIINFIELIESPFLFMIFRIEQLVTSADIIQLDPNGILINLRSIVFRVLLRIVHDKRTHVPNGTAVVPGILLRAVILDKPKINQLDHI
jgi:hypothetical protein